MNLSHNLVIDYGVYSKILDFDNIFMNVFNFIKTVKILFLSKIFPRLDLLTPLSPYHLSHLLRHFWRYLCNCVSEIPALFFSLSCSWCLRINQLAVRALLVSIKISVLETNLHTLLAIFHGFKRKFVLKDNLLLFLFRWH